MTREPGAIVRRVPALGRRNYRIFFTVQSISLVGTWMQTLGQAWLIVVLTRDPFVLGLMTAAQGLPLLLFSLFAGAIADRVDKRRILMVTPFVSMAVALTLGVLCLTGQVQVWHTIALAFVLGTISSIELPCRQAFITEMVGPALVPSALGLNAASYNAGRLVGPAIGGVLIGITTGLMGGAVEGTGVAFLINAATYVVVIAGYAAMRPAELLRPPRRQAPRGVDALLGEIGEGLTAVRRDRPLLLTIVVPGVVAVLAMNFNVFIPLVALAFDLDAGGLGFLMAMNGVGALISAVRIGIGGASGTRTLIAGGAVLGGSLVATGVATGLQGPVPLVAVLLLVAGYAGTSMRVSTNTSVQLATPPEMRGRAMSLFALVFDGTAPAGSVVTGIVASAFGGAVAMVAAGLAALALITAGAGGLREIHLDARVARARAALAQSPTPGAASAGGGPAGASSASGGPAGTPAVGGPAAAAPAGDAPAGGPPRASTPVAPSAPEVEPLSFPGAGTG